MSLRPITTRYTQADREMSSTDAVTLFAGGTDIIPLTRSGVIDAADLLDIKTSSLPRSIERRNSEWTIGALVTLAELERYDELRQTIPAISHALSQVATLQIRHRATVGGNLLQRPRCSYFRDADVDCWMKGGSSCPAIDGRNEHLALAGQHCVAPQPSDLAAVLVALDADVSVASGQSAAESRRMAISDFLVAPSPDRRSLHALADGEILTAIHIPDGPATSGSYVKAMDRAVWQFALVGLAAVVTSDDGGVVERARLVASGVANTPMSLDSAAQRLVGSTLDDDTLDDAAGEAARGLVSLSENRYKIDLLRGLVIRSLESIRP
ncbi:MAG: FAD binding domain-containing protein [Ilumatobacter sp.]|uniref:FAD binding domain-containing protein n=1 Tax=Ilumatobacter sp. TaxID=1967498 RepID=UPI003C7184E6